MRKLLIFGVLLLTVVSTSQAALVPVDFSTEFVGYELDLTYGIVENVFSGAIGGISVRSAAYSNDSSYVYLYQVINSNVTGLYRMTADPFAGLIDDSVMGYVNGGEPDSFVSGGVAIDFVTANIGPWGPVAGFDFALPINEISAVMFIKSNLPPGEIYSEVKNGRTVSGTVLGAVPEPATVCLFGLGALGLLRRRKNV